MFRTAAVPVLPSRPNVACRKVEPEVFSDASLVALPQFGVCRNRLAFGRELFKRLCVPSSDDVGISN